MTGAEIQMALAAAQGVGGLIQTITGGNQAKRLLGQRRAYTTPEEYFKLLNATKSMASQGFDAFTLNYLTNQTDRAFSSSIETARRLGADPNDLSAIFDQKIQATMKIGAENHALNLQNFSKYLSALDLIGQNKAAEWKSQQDILKDKQQAAAGNKNQGMQNIGNAISAFLSGFTAQQTGNLYNSSNSSFAPSRGAGEANAQ